jgi:hypothetical protein
LRRLCAKFAGQRLDLAARFFEGPGAIDFLGGEAQFFLDGELGGNTAAGFRFAEAARDEAFELLLGGAPDDHQAIELFVDAGFDEQRRLDEDGIADTGAPPDLELAEDDFGDARVHDGVETVQLGAICEDHSTEFRAVDAAGRIGDRRPKFLDDFGVGRLAGFDEFVPESVCSRTAKPVRGACGNGATPLAMPR